MEGLEVSELDSIPFNDARYYVMPLGAAWGLNPGGRSWGPGSSYSSYQTSLSRDMLEDWLRCHYSAWVNFSCVARYAWSSSRFSNFLGLWPYSCAPQWIMCCQRPHSTGGKCDQLWCLILGPSTLCRIGSFWDRLCSSPLVPIWVSLPELNAVGLLGLIQGSTRCGTL